MLLEGLLLAGNVIFILAVFLVLSIFVVLLISRLLLPITKMEEMLTQKRMKNEVRWRQQHHKNLYKRDGAPPDHAAAISAAIAAHRAKPNR